MTVLTLGTAVIVSAQPLSPQALDRILDQLGADEFKLREEAGRSVAEHARREPEAMRAALNKRLLRENDPEIQYRIKHVLAIISRIVRVALPARGVNRIGAIDELRLVEIRQLWANVIWVGLPKQQRVRDVGITLETAHAVHAKDVWQPIWRQLHSSCDALPVGGRTRRHVRVMRG